ncbi:hypothetical protein S83_030529 [Arachis hypogaea]
MVPITTCFLMIISSVFYVFRDAAQTVLAEDFSPENHLGFPFTTMGYGISHPDVPLLL